MLKGVVVVTLTARLDIQTTKLHGNLLYFKVTQRELRDH